MKGEKDRLVYGLIALALIAIGMSFVSVPIAVATIGGLLWIDVSLWTMIERFKPRKQEDGE